MDARVCELCNCEATLYCTSDSAFLCSSCDAKVHHANFLVARHVRRPLCPKCKGFSGGFFSGAEIRNLHPVCRSCSEVEQPSSEDGSALSSSSSSSSTCVSSSESISNAPTKNGLDDRPKNYETAASSFMTVVTEVDPNKFPVEINRNVKISMESKARSVFENWCKKMGLENWKPIVSIAAQAFSLCIGRLAALPSRVALAASFWLGLRFSGDRSMPTIQNLTGLEEISGVAAKVIVIAERKLSLVLRARRGRRELKEGWAECSV